MRLIHGECLEEMDKLIAEGVKVDAIICDPPYGTTACKWDGVIPFDEMWKRINVLCKNKYSPVVLNCSQPFTSVLVASNLKQFKYTWVWDKRYPANYPQAKRQPMKRHEDIAVFNSNIDTYHPQMTLRDTPIKKSANKGATVFNKGLEREDYKHKIYTHKYPESILYFPTRQEGKKVHPTQKPVALLEYLVKTYTNEGNTVLDFTMGSGTTGVACKKLNRHFIGIEKDDKYFEIAKNRISI